MLFLAQLFTCSSYCLSAWSVGRPLFSASHLSFLTSQIAVLLRVASLVDLVFLLNHVMRCPPGFANKIAHFIQFPVPHYCGDGYNIVDEQYYWDNPLIHHFVALLAGILQPIRLVSHLVLFSLAE